jgi:hypothetical protein
VTLELLRKEIYSHIGEPSDLDPDSDTSYSGGPLLNFVVNEGQRQVAAWRDPESGRIFRVRSLISDLYYKTTYISGELDSDSASTTIVLPAVDVESEDDRYNGWIVVVGSEVKLIVDYVGATHTGTVHSSWSTTPENDDEYELYKSFDLLLPSSHDWVSDHISLPAETDRSRATGNLIEVLKISDLESGRTLELPGREEDFISNVSSAGGDPSQWLRVGNKILYDQPVPEEKWLKMEYFRLPTELVDSTDEPEIPEHLQWGIVLWGIQWGYSRHQEPSMKWSAKTDFRDFMKSATSTYAVSFERADDAGVLQLG